MTEATPAARPVFDLVVSQGRIADRTPGAILGAALTADLLGAHITGQRSEVGKPAACADDDWRVSLPQARETLSALNQEISQSLGRGHVPLMVANTCSASLASLPAAARTRSGTVFLWIDAHGDFNTPETTTSGYLGGMALAAACGLWDSGHGVGPKPKQVVLIGAHDIDPDEAVLLHEHGVRIIPPAEANADNVLRIIGNSPVWVHIDWDVLEPELVPAAYSVPGGLLPWQIKDILAALAPEQLVGLELAEFEATGNEQQDSKALGLIRDMVEPLLPIPV